MNWDGARNAKAEVLTKAFGFQEIAAAHEAESGPVFAPKAESEAYRQIENARRSKTRDPLDLIAVGILDQSGHNRDPDDLQLGIFIQRKRLMDHPIVQQAVLAARGEARVIFTGPIRRFGANTGRCRPLRIGASVGHYLVSAGTLGCFVAKRSGGVGILSNNHILADTNRGKVGDMILQPGKADGGQRSDAADHIAMLDKFVALRFDPGSINYVDCAFAYLLDGIKRDTLKIGDPQGNQVLSNGIEDLVYPTLPVNKVGRQTGQTRGLIEATEIDNLQVAFGFAGLPSIARFDRQIGIVGRDTAFSKPGDSGALIVTDDNKAVALLFAGSERGGLAGRGITFANPIGAVLDALEVEIYTGA